MKDFDAIDGWQEAETILNADLLMEGNIFRKRKILKGLAGLL